MKKYFVMTMLMVMGAVCADAQVVFSKIKFHVAVITDFTQQQLETKFKVTSERPIKYVTVGWAAVNEVGDAISDDVVGGVNANVEPTKYHNIIHTGPFKKGQSKTSHFGIYHFHSGKRHKVMPYRLTIEYMGGGKEVIDITKDNIKTFFPCVKWIDVDYKSGL